MVTIPHRFPLAVGVNVTPIVQLVPAATQSPHVFVCAKSPLAPMLVRNKTALLRLVSVTDCAALVVTTCCLPKFRDSGERLIAGVPVAKDSDMLGAVGRLCPQPCQALRARLAINSAIRPTHAPSLLLCTGRL